MPRDYKRRSNRNSWDSKAMENAIAAVSRGEMGLKRASKAFEVPKTTLRRRVKGTNIYAKQGDKSLGRLKPTFPPEIEEELVSYIIRMEEMMFGTTTTDIRRLAYQLAVRNQIPNKFDDDKEIAGLDWLAGFMKRHPQLSLRTPEATSAARARGFNQTAVGKFFDLLESLMEEHHFEPHNIYNVDETGMSTVQGKPSKIIAKKGRRQVGTLTSAERGTLVTAEICINVTGSFVPPLFIFPRVRMKPELMDGAPIGSIYECHKSG
ncbi:uncharacterized protein [Apostichopus japonicus]|uniref:uncharacterized protein n=1 Tax=Stichopus japonicus TaxID=307972 RepID=UPI003AB53F56